MEDFEIVELYWDRNENAITQTDRKYGKYCRKIAFSIVNDREDMEECVNDTYLQTWNSLPPQRPEKLSTYLGLDEISELVGGSSEVEEQLDLTVLTDLINKFLKRCEKQARTVFVQRYWYMMSVKEIARENRMSDSNVKMTLSRTREKLKLYLEEEGYSI